MEGRSCDPAPADAEHAAEAQGEALNPVHVDEVADGPRRQPPGGQTAQRPRAGDPLDLDPERVHVLLVERPGHAGDRLVQRLGPGGVGRAAAASSPPIGGAREEPGGNAAG